MLCGKKPWCSERAPNQNPRDVSRVGSTIASARLPYAFSSLRLRSNLARIVCELKKLGGMHLVAGFWRDFKSVVRIGGRRSIDSATRKRGLKVTFRSYCNKFYRLGVEQIGDLTHISGSWAPPPSAQQQRAAAEQAVLMAEVCRSGLPPAGFYSVGAGQSADLLVFQVVYISNGQEKVAGATNGQPSRDMLCAFVVVLPSGRAPMTTSRSRWRLPSMASRNRSPSPTCVPHLGGTKYMGGLSC